MAIQDIRCRANNNRQFFDFNDASLLVGMEAESARLGQPYRTYLDIVRYRRRPRILWEERDLACGDASSNASYRTLKRRLDRNAASLAKAMAINPEYIGWHEFTRRLENLPADIPIRKFFEQKEYYEHEYRQAIRLVDTDAGEDTSLLVENTESVINHLANLTVKSLIVFYVEPEEDADECFRNGLAAMVELRE